VGALRADAGVAIRWECQIMPDGRAATVAMFKGRWVPGFALGGTLMSGLRQSASHRDGGLPMRSHLRRDLWRASMCSWDM